MRIAAITSMMDLISYDADCASVASISQQTAAEAAIESALEPLPGRHFDKITWRTVMVIFILLVEAIVAAGTCGLTQNVLDQMSNDFLGNTHLAIDAMLTIATIMSVADIVLAIRWIARRFQRTLTRLPANA
jgi:hypothetical protein